MTLKPLRDVMQSLTPSRMSKLSQPIEENTESTREILKKMALASYTRLQSAKMHMPPIEPKALMVILDRMFTVLPMPDPAALIIWREKIEHYPESVIQNTVESLIETYKYPSPPSIAHFLEIAEADAGYKEWSVCMKNAEQIEASYAKHYEDFRLRAGRPDQDQCP
jgi:hypothetical protein